MFDARDAWRFLTRGGDPQFSSWFSGCGIFSGTRRAHVDLKGGLAILKDEGILIPEWGRELRQKEKKAEEGNWQKKDCLGFLYPKWNSSGLCVSLFLC